MQRAFGVALAHTTIEGETYRVREGNIYLPAELQGYVVGVLGLDNRPQATPHFRILGEQGAAAAEAAQAGGFARAHAAGGASFTPVQVAQLYQFPPSATASGQTIGIIELGGGFRPADIAALFQVARAEAARRDRGAGRQRKEPSGQSQRADGEVMLDIEVAGAVAPGARIVVYFAPNTDQGFVDAITQLSTIPTTSRA